MHTSKIQDLNIDASSRVLFVHRGSLLDDCVMSLVGTNTELDVVKVDYISDELLCREITKNCPDFVMMGQERAGKVETLLSSIASNPALEKLRVIVYHSNDNYLDVYSPRQMHAIPSGDFLTLVQGVHATL